jgi:putative ABC transport system ATP-binding protein
MNEGQLATFRSKRIGFIFQFFNLVPTLTALENVILPMELAESFSQDKMMSRAVQLLNLVGLGERLHHMPNQLSGGQQQRVAIARALANEPSIVIADEPTGNLDSEGGLKIMHFIQHLNKTMNQTFILVTHDPNIANMTRNVVQMLDGRILETTRPSKEEPTEQASLKTQRKLLLSEMEWLKKSLRLEEQWIEKKPEAYNDAVTEYTKRWKRLKQSLREIGLEEV